MRRNPSSISSFPAAAVCAIGTGTTQVGPGDAFLFQPGEAHQLSNAGNEDFVYYVIADNPRSGGATGDSCYYPDSDKWAVSREECEELIVKGTETDYFDGEE